jgi:hypothetical protein
MHVGKALSQAANPTGTPYRARTNFFMGHASDPAISVLADEQRTIGRNGEFKSNQLIVGSFRTVSRAQ